MKRKLLMLVLLFALIGCKKSSTTAPPAAAASPTPAQAQKSAPPATPKPYTISTKPPPDLGAMIPVKTFQVKPPASFTPDQFPQDGAVEFLVPGSAGQALLVKLTEVGTHSDPYGMASRARLEVRFLDVGSPALEPGGDASGNWLYTLSQTGTYRVMLDPAGYKQNIQFTLLASGDPMVDPGIRAEQISIDFGSFARNDQLALVPYANFEGYMDPAWPSHLGLQTKHLEFRIMPVAGYKKVFETEKDNSMARLEAALQPGAKAVAGHALPYPVYGDRGYNMEARQELLHGEGWRGLRWIGGFGQDTACRPDLAYVFEGITDDGRFFIMIRAAISHPATEQRWAKGCTSDAEAPKINARLERDLAAADPGSFHPNLDQLDAVIKSLKL